MARLFLAVWPPEEVVADLMALPRKDQRGVRFVPPGNWHVTLRFLGEADPADVCAALEHVALPRATVRIGPGVDVMADRAVVVPVHGLDEIARLVNEHTAAIGEPPRKRFVGHLTVARVKPHVAMPRAVGMAVSGTFEPDEIALVRSRLDPDGARYDTVESWPLG